MAELLREKIDFKELAGRIPYAGSPLVASEFDERPRDLGVDMVGLKNILHKYAKDFATSCFQQSAMGRHFSGVDFCPVDSDKTLVIVKSSFDRARFSQELFSCRDRQAVTDLMDGRYRPGHTEDGVIEMASFSLCKDMNEWDMPHRLVEVPYRKGGLGEIFMAANETFAQQYANLTSQPQSISLLPAQLSVIVWFLNCGYEGATEEDSRRIDFLLNYRHGNGVELRMKNHDQRARDYWLQTRRQRQPGGLHYWETFRIKLVKKVEPRRVLDTEACAPSMQMAMREVANDAFMVVGAG